MGRPWIFLLAVAAIVLRVGAAAPVADEEAELRAEFDAMDADKDGLIDRDELAKMEDAPSESDINGARFATRSDIA